MTRVKNKTRKKPLNKKEKNYVVGSETYRKRFICVGVVVFLLFLTISLRLYQVMLREQHKYEEELKALATTVVEGPSAPRGRILDRNGKVIVDNKAIKTIYYQKEKKMTTQEEISLAYTVSSHISLPFDKLTERMKREFFVAKNAKEMERRITRKEYEKLEQRKITSEDILALKLERVTLEELENFSQEDQAAAYLYYLMNKGYTYDEKVIKTGDVTEAEYAYIAENNAGLKGFNTKLDWERTYPYGEVFKTMLGSVSSNGLPSEEKQAYLKKGYSLNDRVGISYLEKQYEEYLKGTKAVYKVLNRHELQLVEEGKRGNDLVLSIDIELQKQLEDILNEEILSTKGQPNTQYYNRSFAIVQDPFSGEILAMAGREAVKDGISGYKTVDYTAGILTSPMTSGSVVKGASMLVGYNTGAIKPGDYQVDECVKIASTKQKCSWKTLGRINDIDALALSSNVYQFKTAMKVAGSSYSYNMPFVIRNNAWEIYRNTFHQFGLGVKTEIDLPVESLGYHGKNDTPGLLLDFVMGQYETYTPIQLSQYVSTMANGGNRMQPHLLKEVHQSTEGEALGDLMYQFEPRILNKVDTKEEYLKRVQEGFHAVTTFSYGLGKNYIDAVHDPSGKTGTSQSFTDTNGDGVIDTETVSTAFIGYAPTASPKMSLTVTSPDSSVENPNNSYSTLVTRRISKRVSDAYFSLYP